MRIPTIATPLVHAILVAFCPLLLVALRPANAGAQSDSVTVRITVRHDSLPVAGARVGAMGRLADDARRTSAEGRATLTLAPGMWMLVTSRLGFRPDTLHLVLGASRDTSVVVTLTALEVELEAFVIAATRSERRIEDTPLRVETIDEEEIAEKVAMMPGDITMMLNETSGLRVQNTNPSLGGANVRIQGLRGRYSLILADGLPLYGQSGGLGLLQIPPVDLGRVEVIKGTASALYGSAALGGVIDLVSRRPTEERERTILLNQTSQGGMDAVFFGSAPLGRTVETGSGWSYSTLLGAHKQKRGDMDMDGWSDMPGYERFVVRPRLYFDDGAGRTAFVTAGYTLEDRRGGTLPGGTVPDAISGPIPFRERLQTQRADVGALVRRVLAGDGLFRGAIVTTRGSAVDQRHRQVFGDQTEHDRHSTWFGEASVALPREGSTWVFGAALQQDSYENQQLPAFDHSFAIPAVFAQADVDAAKWLTLSASARADAHSEFGTFVSPRVSALVRAPREDGTNTWTLRLSRGAGISAPSPLTEETEATGLVPLRFFGDKWHDGLQMERAIGSTIDLNVPITIGASTLDLNATGFSSRVTHALQVYPAGGSTPGGASTVALASAPGPTRTWGAELLLRLTRMFGGMEMDGMDMGGEGAAMFRITASYAFLRSTECDPEVPGYPGTSGDCARRDVPLTPRQTAAVVMMLESEEVGRIGIELYHTGVQPLVDDPYRDESRPYLIAGLMGEKIVATRFGRARIFLNLENLTNVRQTKYDPILRQLRGPGGRWSTDAWADLMGFAANGGIRLSF